MKKFLVNCKKYNNSKNVLFMMDQDDDRAGDGNYDIVEKGKSKKGIFYTDSGKKYQIHADWSLTDVRLKHCKPTQEIEKMENTKMNTVALTDTDVDSIWAAAAVILKEEAGRAGEQEEVSMDYLAWKSFDYSEILPPSFFNKYKSSGTSKPMQKTHHQGR